MTSPSHTHTQARVHPINTYNHTYIKFFTWTKQNNLTLNPDKTTCSLLTPDPAEYKSNLDLKINNTALAMATHQRFWALPLTINSHTTHTFTTSQYNHTRHYK